MSQQNTFQVYQAYSDANNDVAPLLNMQAFTNSTSPTLATVQKFILYWDSFIDRATAFQFRMNFVQDEYYDFNGIGPRAGIILLRKRPVLSIERVQWYDGTKWNDGIQAAPQDPIALSSQLEPFFFYPEKGKIEFYKLRTTQRRQGVRASYTWGYTQAPAYITNLSASLAAYEVHRAWAAQFNVAEDVMQWKKDMGAKINSLFWQAGVKASGWSA